MSAENIFGPVVTGKDVVDAAVATMKKWCPDYLAEIAEHSGRARGDLPLFRSYVPMINLNKFNEDQVPTCVVIAPGTIDTPVKRAKQVQVRWGLGVGCVVSGQNDENSYELATLYVAAVRMMLLQQKSLGGFAEGVNWISERYDALPDIDSRSFTAGVIQFGVDVNNVVDPTQGPKQQSPDVTVDPGVWPVVQTEQLTVVKE